MRPTLALIICISSLNAMSVNLLVPSLQSISVDLKTGYWMAQLGTSLFLFASGFGFAFFGPLSDRIGRRTALLLGLVVFAAASGVCALAPSAAALNAARIVQGFAASSGQVLGQAIVRDRYDRESSASVIGYLALGFGVPSNVAPLVGGYIDQSFGWRANFGLLTAIGVALILAAFVVLNETTRFAKSGVSPRRDLLSDVKDLAQIPSFWAFTLVYVLSAAVFYAFLAGTSYASQYVFQLSPATFGLYFIGVNLGYSLGAFLTGRFVRRFGIARMIAVGAGVAALATASMTVALALGWFSPLVLFVPMLAVNFANGLMQSNAIASVVSVRPDLAGTASGAAGALQVTGCAIAMIIVGAVIAATRSELGFATVALIIALGTLAASQWAWRGKRRGERLERKREAVCFCGRRERTALNIGRRIAQLETT